MTTATSDAGRSLSDTGHQRIASFPSRQRRMGPAPLASFEDLSMDKTNSDSSPEDKTLLSNIEEMSGHDTPVSPSVKDVLGLPTSPKIRVSVASTPSQHESDSKDSTPDKEIFTGYQKSEFCEQMSDLKNSTAELGNEERQNRGKKRKVKNQNGTEVDKKDEALKIADFIRKESSSSIISDSLMPASAHSSRLSSIGSIGSPIRRSPSPHKMLLETSFCGNKPIQHPSIDIEDPPLSVSKLISSNMEKFDTYKPKIDSQNDIHSLQRKQPSKVVESSNEKAAQNEGIKETFEIECKTSQGKLDQQPKSLQKRQDKQRRQAEHHDYHHRQGDQMDTSKHIEDNITQQQEPNGNFSRETEERDNEKQKTSDKRSNGAKSPRLGKKVPLPQIPDPKNNIFTSATLPRVSQKQDLILKSEPDGEFVRQSRTLTRHRPSDDPEEYRTPSDSRMGSSSSHKRPESTLSPDTPESPSSTSGRKSPFSTFMKSSKVRSRSRSRSRSKSRERDQGDDTHDRRKKFSLFNPLKKKNKSDKKEEAKELENYPMEISSPLNLRDGLNKDQLQATDIYDGFIEINSRPHSKPCSPILPAGTRETFSTFKPPENGELQSILTKNGSGEEKNNSKRTGKTVRIASNTADISRDQNEGDSYSISESDKYSEVLDELKKRKLPDGSASPDIETLVSQESFEDDGELPFAPTTLPLERLPFVPPIVPIRDRQALLKITNSIDRPRSTTPIQPSKLEAYKQSSQELLDPDADKLTITIKAPPPGAIKVLPSTNVKGQTGKSWEDFCCEGLKSPRELRHEYQTKQQTIESEEIPVPPPPPPPPRSSATQSLACAKTPSPSHDPSKSEIKPPNWIDFNEIPSIVLKPVRQIKISQTKDKPTELDIKFMQNSSTKKILEEEEKLNIEAAKLAEITQETEDIVSISESLKDESSEHSSDTEDKSTSTSSSAELEAINENAKKIKAKEDLDLCDNSDLEALLAPVNECITKLSSLSAAESSAVYGKKSPIPDNWEDFLLPPQPGRRSRLSSISSDICSIGRSPSPSHMILETSFCGSQPIDDPALAEPNVPIPLVRKLSGISLGDMGLGTYRPDRGSIQSSTMLLQPDRTSIISDSSADVGSPKGSEREFSEGHSKSLNPFGMDLNVKSNRSSVISQDQSPPDTPHCS